MIRITDHALARWRERVGSPDDGLGIVIAAARKARPVPPSWRDRLADFYLQNVPRHLAHRLVDNCEFLVADGRDTVFVAKRIRKGVCLIVSVLTLSMAWNQT